MCFFMAQNQPIKGVEKRFKAKVDKPDNFLQSDYIVGFEYLNIPIILDKTPEIITTDYHWGLVPSWSKDIDFRKNTLNARIETINEKPSFRNITQNRCLVIGSSFFEWHWNDIKGKSKTKYEIHSSEDELFAFGGLYTSWTDLKTGNVLNSFTIVTTQANDKMKYIHNHAQRMPVMLRKSDEMAWLNDNSNVQDYAFPYSAELIAFQV